MTVDQATSRARAAVAQTDTSAQSRQSLQLDQLEPRVLFSAAPIDIAMIDGADEVTTTVMEIAASNEGKSAEESVGSELGNQSQVLNEVIVIDSSVPNLDEFLADLDRSGRQSNVFVLDADRDGVEQITEILSRQSDVDSLHIVSHGNDGGIKLGNLWLTDSTMDGYAGQIASWQSALSNDADILIYGCDLAGNQSGLNLIESLTVLTEADVAASSNATGHEQYDADWTLEYATGSIDTAIVVSADFQSQWVGKLAVIQVTTGLDVVNASDGLTSLREAILQVNNGSGGDTIELQANTTYEITNAGSDDKADVGDFDIKKDVTIIGVDAGTTIIDAKSNARIFEVISGAQLTLRDVSLVGGQNVDAGGAIRVDHSSGVLIAERVMIMNNQASDGAGIYNKGTMTLTDVVISGNGNTTDTIEGGGIHNKGGATLNRVTISGNFAKDDGGGIHQDNSADPMTITNSTISGNTSLQKGGGINAEADLTVYSSTIAFNTSSNGGGVMNNGGVVSIRDTIIAENLGSSTADVEGGFNSLGNNLIGDSNGGSGYVGADLRDRNANLSSLMDGGGYGNVHFLLAGSEAIDAGSTSAPSTDQRGQTRIGAADIGAFEYAPVALTESNDFQVSEETDAASNINKDQGTISVSAGVGAARAVAMADDGSYVVVWSSLHQDGSFWGVYARRFDATGAALTGEILVNQTTNDNQCSATVDTDSEGNFVVTWTSKNQDGTNKSVYARVFNANGSAKTAEFRVNATNTGTQQDSVVAIDRATGDIVIAWEGEGPGDSTGIFFRRFTSDGTAIDGNDRVGDASGTTTSSVDLAIQPSGRFVMAYQENGNIHVKRFDSDGFEIAHHHPDGSSIAAYDPAIATNAAGEVAVVAHVPGGGVPGVWIATYPDDISDVNGFGRLSGSSDGSRPSVAYGVDDRILVTWQEPNSGDGIDVMAKWTHESSEFRVNTTTAGDQSMASLAVYDNDNFVVAWTGPDSDGTDGVFARQFGTVANEAPVANVGSIATMLEGGSLSLDANASSDPESNSLTYEWDLNFDGSTFVADNANVSPTLSWADLQAFGIVDDGTYDVALRVHDGNSYSAIAVQQLTVANVDPVANSDSEEFTAVSGLSFVTGSVLHNDTDANPNDTLSVLSISNVPADLTVTQGTNGSFTIDPGSNFEFLAAGDSTTRSFNYTLSDGDGGTSTSTVSLVIKGTNDAPNSLPDSDSTVLETPVTINVLGNDSDPEGVALTVTTVTQGTNGSVVNNLDGTVTYTANALWAGTDTFTYTVSDGILSTTETVTIDVTNQSPTIVANSSDWTIDEGDGLTLDATGSTDPEGNAVTYQWDVNHNGTTFVADFTTQVATLQWSDLQALGVDDDGVYQVAVRVSDGIVTSQADFDLTVNNVAPQISVSGNSEATLGEVYTLNLSAVDPGDDTQTWVVSWGDGTVSNVVGPTATHVFTNGGMSHNITVAVVDDDGTWHHTSSIVTADHSSSAPRDGFYRFEPTTGQLTAQTGQSLLTPEYVTIGPDGIMYVGDSADATIWRYDSATGSPIGTGPFITGVADARVIEFGPANDIYVMQTDINTISRYDFDGNLLGIFATAAQGDPIDTPADMMIHEGYLYVVNSNSDRVDRFDLKTGDADPAGGFIPSGTLNSPSSITLGPDGMFYIANNGGDNVFRYDINGTNVDSGAFLDYAGASQATDITFGPDGYLYLTIQNQDRVQRYDASGTSGVYVDDYIGAPKNIGTLTDPRNIVFLPSQQVFVRTLPTVENPISDKIAIEDSAFSFHFDDGVFDDLDGDDLVYTATLADGTTPLPSWLHFDAATRTFSGTPENGDVGTITIRVTGDDQAQGTVSDLFDLTVQNTNDAPTLEHLIADQSTNEDSPFAFTIPANVFADVDAGDTLTYSATLSNGAALPSWLSLDATTGEFTGTPVNADVGTITIRVTAQDAAGVPVSDVFDLNIVNVNDAPILASPLMDVSLMEDDPWTFAMPVGTFVDVDLGDTITYTAHLAGGDALPDWLEFENGTLQFSGTPGNPAVGVLDVVITADDGEAITTDSFEIEVVNVNDAPTVQPIRKAADFNTPVRITLGDLADSIDDVDSALVTPIVSGATGGTAVVNPNGSITFTPDPGFTGVASFALQATDGSLVSDAAKVLIKVETPAVPPTGGSGSEDEGEGEENSEEGETENSEENNTSSGGVDNGQDDDDDDDQVSIFPPTNDVVESANDDDDKVLVFETAVANELPVSQSFMTFNQRLLRNMTDESEAPTRFLEQNVVDEILSHTEFALMTSPARLWNQLDATRDELDLQIQGDLIKIGSLGAATSGFTVGFVAYALRGGFLLSGFLTHMPAWRAIDPMLIMQGLGGDGESLEDIMDRQAEALDD